MDTSSEMSLDMMSPTDAQMYMSSEVMALFNGGGVDVASLFLPEFPQAPPDSHGTASRGGFSHGPQFQKINGPVMSP